MDVTTIKLQKETKTQLNKIKEDRDTYDDLIRRLIAKEKQKHLKEDLINAYKELGKEELKILNEWESTSQEV